ncbi:hypothetical protein A2962_02515 [Candidatus Woesebacteria bacterium RIFCSPLOWO2_01_FULL_39_61]|uniref:Uncharacterized protein n=1 Tax=Candidatus Woesebacteria bacterium RIFCSPHIGHO2_02_FULL_39_13 TaxID=1802505 RepID=A0A1F7YWV6_9BACT|nr:MAG: hypothetical protein A2692_02080 [Candidatus Woesebacteria bacterium RIFCSPHIGHO2_01_FULL_39_95]OGM31771.1 MAG: hypothetical protein A3D01_04375 [Candidatus Woesebacteria bacterium RIFCSPHIGHO2_02_FULL_39_13]OGM36263.1 MAG: hypothetical protein A3E13_03465 [Candidatus Woesebacteria bacterium RIFCSPHIGHO2_12_FULL_40_20]OGM68671.1 MAG: hypothetical protein A2962_02515 [Candidatus Woesebacteria bacterium RIFCSPLOWO2_01_FULL_39_61]OGM72179.1 MAG: hypothetical protein A3H19_06420 [Candidatus
MIYTVLETPHVIVGAAIATKIINPALAIPLAFASHFVLEMVPHWNPHLNTEKKKYGHITDASKKIVVVDVLAATASGIYIASLTLPDVNRFLIIILAAFFSSLPDIIEAPYFFLNLKSAFLDKWVAFQKSLQSDAEIIPGLLTQTATIIAAFWWILG